MPKEGQMPTGDDWRKWGGPLVLLISLPLVYGWIYWFFLAGTEIPVNGIGQSQLCAWQVSMCNHLTWNGYSPLPFLGLMTIEAVIFLYRVIREGRVSGLTVEFGLANLVFVVVGIALFVLVCILYIGFAAIQGSQEWLSRVLGWHAWGNPEVQYCEPTFPAVPGIVTFTILGLALIFTLATGAFGKGKIKNS